MVKYNKKYNNNFEFNEIECLPWTMDIYVLNKSNGTFLNYCGIYYLTPGLYRKIYW